MKHTAVEHDDRRTHRPTLDVPRSRGAVSGLALIVLGAWGALLPYLGPSFTFGFGPAQSWHWTAARFWLQLLPGVVTLVSGIGLLLAGNRVVGSFWAYLAAAAGAWFVVGPVVGDLHRAGYVGQPLGGNTRAHLDAIAAFYGLGAVIVFFAALIAGRLSVVGVRDVRTAEKRHEAGVDDAATGTVDPAAVYPPSRDVDVRTTSIRPAEAPVSVTSAAQGARSPDGLVERESLGGDTLAGGTTSGRTVEPGAGREVG